MALTDWIIVNVAGIWWTNKLNCNTVCHAILWLKKKKKLKKGGNISHLNLVKRLLHTESEIFVPNFRTLKNKKDLMLYQSRLHTASDTFVQHKKIRLSSIFCTFASEASILIRTDDKYEKRTWKFGTQCEMH